MNKNIIIALVVVLVAGTGIFVFASSGDDSSDDTDTTTNQLTTTNGQSQTGATNPAPTSTPSLANYVEYSDQALADASGTNRVVFFHAEWCSTCKFFENSIKQAGVPADVTILEADFDNDTALKDRYDVSVQSTFVLLDEGANAIRSWPFGGGLRSADDLFNAIAEEV